MRTEGQTDIVAFRNFVNAPQKGFCEVGEHHVKLIGYLKKTALLLFISSRCCSKNIFLSFGLFFLQEFCVIIFSCCRVFTKIINIYYFFHTLLY
jgi:hypothetical protein